MKTRCEKAVLLTHVTFAKALEIPFVNKAKWKKSLDHDIRKGPVFFLINRPISVTKRQLIMKGKVFSFLFLYPT